jgi:hypothetical protein
MVAGACFLLARKAHMAAAYLGAWIVLLVMVIYGPVLIGALADPSTEGVNYFADALLFGGAIFRWPAPTGSNRQWAGMVCGCSPCATGAHANAVPARVKRTHLWQ